MCFIPVGLSDEPKDRDQKRECLEKSAPKIVDAKKYYGPAVTDFATIKKRMEELA